MGVDSRKAPPLPAPTETDTATPTELTAEISRPGDEKSTYSLPDDGTPVTIRTRSHRANRSQTSLLIEYFEGGKSTASGTSRKPSVRVRLTPSKKGRGDHIQVTETKTSRKSSVTRRIPLEDVEYPEAEDGHSITSYASATEESNVSRNPIDIEIDRSHRRRRPASPLIPTGERESYIPGSEISAIPTDSFLDGANPGVDLRRSGSPYRAESVAASILAGSAVDDLDDYRSSKVRSSGKQRSKSEAPKDKSESRKRRSKSRASSISEPPPEESYNSRRRSSRSHHQESHVSAVESSMVSTNLAPSHRSMDTRSMRSGVSKSSINNPKLLETVEDAIRRLILPELSALKREQSKRESRRESLTSTGTSASRDVSTDRRRSSGPRLESTKETEKPKERRNREARHDYDDLSLHSASHDSMIDGEYLTNDIDTPKRTNTVTKATNLAPVVAPAPKEPPAPVDEQSETGERKQRERRRRRTESARSRSLGPGRYGDEYEDEEAAPAPPMPLMSEINPSELTRTSILSVDSERPHSASEELGPGHDLEGGATLDGAATPTPSRTPIDLQHTLGTSHANVSHGDLTALPRGKKEYTDAQEFETDEFGRKIPTDQYGHYEETTREISDPGDYPDEYEDSYYSQQDVPPLSTESEAPLPGNARSMNSASDAYSPDKSPRLHHSHSMQSLDSASNLHSRDYDAPSPQGKRDTMYSEDSQPAQTAAGKPVRGLGANVNIINPPISAESAVASLIDGSMLDQSVLTAGSGYDYGMRGSNISYDDQSKVYSNRGISPEKASASNYQEYDEDRHATPDTRSIAQSHQSHDYSEYELDEHGRKVPRTKYRQSPTSSEAAITAGAVGAAAAALKAAKGRKQTTAEEDAEEEFQPAGVFRNKSFKERAMEGWEPRNTPSHSMDRLDYEPPKMNASGFPDSDHPMPELGYLDDDIQTNPSFVQEHLDEEPLPGQWSGKATPTEYGQVLPKEEDEAKDSGLEMTGSTGQAGSGMGGHSREPSQDHDEWQRTSDDRKRDTLVTNPYEDASPIVNPALNENLLATRGYNAPFNTGSPGFQKYDEGYMSNGPNRTPDLDPQGKAVHLPGSTGLLGDDPFYVPKGPVRHLSGMSQGMASPFFDASTGAGIERIENKDIIALMQHLMVRDAQRSARDTEIVALLMNAALEMRNSFREMKELVQDTGDDVIFASVENTEKLQKAINGPRPYPGAVTRSLHSGSIAGTIEDINAKKKNLWKRALQGLSARGTSDLSHPNSSPPGSSAGQGQSYENLQPDMQYEQDKGYEPEGNSTISHASHASQSGHLSLPQGQGRQATERRYSDHRISTVPENEEEYEYDHPTPTAERTNPDMLIPSLPDNIPRGGSAPPEIAAQHGGPSVEQPHSADNTPKSDKGKKSKSGGSGSSWFPKISRWSGTTASSVSKALRGGKKEAKYDDQAPSRSNSSLASHDDYHHDTYGDDKLHSGYSDQQLAAPHQIGDSSIPPIPTYMTPEDPKYKAHRNSLNLQHPQPRTGPTDRYRTALEHSAQEFDAPATPRSADWAGSVSSLNRLQSNTGGYNNAPSSVGQTAIRSTSTPKELVDSPSSQSPPRSNRVSNLQKSPLQGNSYESGYGSGTGTHASQYTATSPRVANKNLNTALGVPARRPSGPRAMTPKSPEEDAAREERRRKRDTFGTVASQDTDTF
ncbi:hypothetical protein PT974_05782 [Cladobotryum mycophilum]|uniref:Transaldolase n=1 Tax=Cladobotryum mycophilum TaxID=491253 RepID=A0ABR0SJR0_9HYPO